MIGSRSVRRRTAGVATAALLAAAVAAGASPGPALAEEAEMTYPVWWSPLLELDSLEGIDARLERQIWPGDDEGLPLNRWDGEVRHEAAAANCLELERLVAAGYEGIGSNGFALQLYNQALCRAIKALRRIRPAERSHLRNFVLNEDAIHVLPAMVNIAISCDHRCRQVVANERLIPLDRFEPVFRVTVKGDDEIVVRTFGQETILTVLARGDFNGDGLDDVLLLASGGATEGTWGGAELYLLTRETPGAVLRVLEEGSHRCADYRCDDSYDEPSALRDSGSDTPATSGAIERRQPITFGVTGEDQGHSDFIEADRGPPFPVWWEPLVGLESLADIDKLLSWENWLTTNGTLLEIESAGKMVEVPAKSCRTLLKMLERGYRLTAAYRSHVSVVAHCRALEWIKSAQPAEVSYLRDFVLDETVMEWLPAALAFWTSPCVALDAWNPSESRKSWASFNAERIGKRRVPTFADGRVYELKILEERRLQAWALAWVVDLEILAGGDFNGDGLDDILAKRTIRADAPGYNRTDLFLLSREAPDDVLRVVQMDASLRAGNLSRGVDDRTTARSPTPAECVTGGDSTGRGHPVWWSDQLELSSLDEIDARARRGFAGPNEGTFWMDKWPGSKDGPVPARNCVELLGYLERQYSIQTDHDLGDRQAMRCRTILALRDAKPSKASHLRGFVLNETSLGLFPLLFRETYLRYGPCRQYLYNEARFSMAAGIGDEPTDGRNVFDSSDPSFRIEPRGDREIVVTTKYRGAHLAIVAGGDFNGDGIDDILLEAGLWRHDGDERDDIGALPRYGETNSLFILSRDDPAGVLWVVNANEFLPSKQDCEDWRAEKEWSIGQQ